MGVDKGRQGRTGDERETSDVQKEAETMRPWRDEEGVTSVPGSSLFLVAVPLEACMNPLILYSRRHSFIFLIAPVFICVN